MKKGDNPYEVLGVAYDVEDEELKKVYRKLALKHHPDRQSTESDKERAHDEFARIAAAYDTLADPVKRYDWKLANEKAKAKIKTAKKAPSGVVGRTPKRQSTMPRQYSSRTAAEPPNRNRRHSSSPNRNRVQAPAHAPGHAPVRVAGAAGTGLRTPSKTNNNTTTPQPKKHHPVQPVRTVPSAVSHSPTAGRPLSRSRTGRRASLSVSEHSVRAPPPGRRSLNLPSPSSPMSGMRTTLHVPLSSSPISGMRSTVLHGGPSPSSTSSSSSPKNRSTRGTVPVLPQRGADRSIPRSKSDSGRPDEKPHRGGTTIPPLAGGLRRSRSQGSGNSHHSSPSAIPSSGSNISPIPVVALVRRGRRASIVKQDELQKQEPSPTKATDLKEVVPTECHDQYAVFEQKLKEHFEEDYLTGTWKKTKDHGKTNVRVLQAKSKGNPSDPRTVVSMTTCTRKEKRADNSNLYDIKTVTKLHKVNGTVQKISQASIVEEDVFNKVEADTITISREHALARQAKRNTDRS